MTIPLRRRSPHNIVCCALNHAAAAAVAFAPMPAANALSACATRPCQTWRKRSCGRRSASEPRSSPTPSMNAQPATYATSASSAVPNAIVFAKSWVSAVLARIASSQSCSDALFAQGLDNPLWVAHMPHQPTTTTTVPAHPLLSERHSCDRGAHRSSVSALQLCFVRCSRRALLKSGNSSPRRRQI